MVMTDLRVARESELGLHRYVGRTVSLVLAGGHPSGADVVLSGRLISVCRPKRTAWMVIDDGDVFLPLQAISSVTPVVEAIPA